MRPVDIWSGSTYAAPGGREYFVQGIRSVPAGRLVKYVVLSGPESGEELTSPLDEFARRVTKRFKENVGETGGRS